MASAALDITFPGNLPLVASIALLRSVPSAQLDATDLFAVAAVSIYSWLPSSLAADDGKSVIKPNDLTVLQAGRWISIGKSGDEAFAQTLTDLKAFSTGVHVVQYDGAPWTWTLGNYTGKADDINIVKADSTSLSVGARVRLDASKISFTRPGITAANYRTLQDKGRDVFSPFDTGIPSSQHNDIRAGNITDPVGAYIAAGLLASSADKMQFPKGKFLIEVPLVTNGRPISGGGRDGTQLIAATQGMEAVIKVQGQNTIISDLYIDALYALSGIKPTAANGMTVARVSCDDAIVANVLFPEAGNNSAATLSECLFRRGGRSRNCGTGTAASGASSVTISGADPTSPAFGLGIVPAYDFVYIAADPRPREITSFTSTSISFFPPLTSAVAAGTPIKVLSGANVRISRAGDASGIVLFNTTCQSAPLFGADCSALYGMQVNGGVYEFNGFAFGLGRAAGGGQQPTISPRIIAPYSEANTYGAAVYQGSAIDFMWEHPMVDGVTQDGLDNMYIANPNNVQSGEAYVRGRRGRNRFLATGITDQLMGVGDNIMFSQSASDPTPTITLMPPTLGSNGSMLSTRYDLVGTILLYLTGGKTFTLRSTAPIVGGSGPTGGYYTYSLGNTPGKEFRFRWVEAFGTNGFMVTGS